MTAKKPPHTPKLRRHSGGQGFVELNGRRNYLGRFDLPKTQQRYHQLIAEWVAGGRQAPIDPEDLTVVELCDRFMTHADSYYRRPDGTQTSTPSNYLVAIRPLRKLYGPTPAKDFGPKALKAVRQDLVEGGCSRGVVNQAINLVRAIFRWGVAEEIIPAGILAALTAVAPLHRGRSDARETDPVLPVSEADINAIRPYVSRQVWALVQLQLLTAARPGELLKLRPVDLDTTDAVWKVTLEMHKTAHHGRQRILPFGPKAQAIIREFLAGRRVDACLFSPREAEQERASRCPTHRRPGQTTVPRATERRMGDHYTTGSYRRAIARACDEAGIDGWTPHRLRHTAATAIRKRFGLEAAQVMLGHAQADVTQVYAEVNRDRAFEVAAQIG